MHSLALVEEGGELIAISLVAWYAFLLLLDNEQPRFSLREIRANFGKRGSAEVTYRPS